MGAMSVWAAVERVQDDFSVCHDEVVGMTNRVMGSLALVFVPASRGLEMVLGMPWDPSAPLVMSDESDSMVRSDWVQGICDLCGENVFSSSPYP